MPTTLPPGPSACQAWGTAANMLNKLPARLGLLSWWEETGMSKQFTRFPGVPTQGGVRGVGGYLCRVVREGLWLPGNVRPEGNSFPASLPASLRLPFPSWHPRCLHWGGGVLGRTVSSPRTLLTSEDKGRPNASS